MGLITTPITFEPVHFHENIATTRAIIVHERFVNQLEFEVIASNIKGVMARGAELLC